MWDNCEDLEGEKEEKWLRPSGLEERNQSSQDR
jgi:hypothetical protein